MKLGISSYTYTWAVGVPGYSTGEGGLTAIDLLKTAYEKGVQVVQICDNLPLHKLRIEELREIRDYALSHGISIEVGTRGVEPEHLRIYLRIAEYLNSNILRTILHKDEGVITVVEAAAYITEVLGEFEAKKIKLAIENHERHSVYDLAGMIKIINSEYVGICLDTVNSFGALESPKEVIRTLAPYTINLHFKDFIIKRLNHMMGFEITGSAAGDGMLEIEELLYAVKTNEKDPNIILELWTPYTGSVEDTILKECKWAEESINYLKECIK